MRTGASDIGSTAAFTPSAAAIFRGHLRKGFAPAQPLAAQHMDRKVAIAELEPVFTPKRLNLGHETPGLSLQPPPRNGIGLSDQRVSDGVQIGADPQVEMIEVIAGVDDH